MAIFLLTICWYFLDVGIFWSFLSLVHHTSTHTNGKKEEETHNFVVELGESFPLSIGNCSVAEVRLWTTARTEVDIAANMNRRLRGDEAGLALYWCFDKDTGKTVFDETDNGNNGTINSDDFSWIRKLLPLKTFRLNTLKNLKSDSSQSFSSLFYYQQEKSALGHDAVKKPLKRSARVMLAGGGDPVSVVDFAVSSEGILARVPYEINLDPLFDTVSGNQNFKDMPLICTDSAGLTIHGASLPDVATSSLPYLYESATGDIGLYYGDQGSSSQLSVNYFNTLTNRLVFKLLTTEQEDFYLTSKMAGINDISLQFQKDATNDLFTLTIKNDSGEELEKWSSLPVKAKKIARILNGEVQKETEYDYDSNASSSLRDFDASKGSSYFVVNAANASGDIDLSKGATPLHVAPERGGWKTSDNSGKAYQSHNTLNLSALGKKISTLSDLTLETWIQHLTKDLKTNQAVKLIDINRNNSFSIVNKENNTIEWLNRFNVAFKQDTDLIQNISVVEAWVKITNRKANIDGQRLNLFLSSKAGWLFHFFVDTKKRGFFNILKRYDGHDDSICVIDTFEFDKWHYINFTYDNQSNKLTCYVIPLEGDLAGRKYNKSISLSEDYDDLNSFTFEGYGVSIDEIRIWNSTKSETQIIATSQRRLSLPKDRTPDLIGYLLQRNTASPFICLQDQVGSFRATPGLGDTYTSYTSTTADTSPFKPSRSYHYLFKVNQKRVLAKLNVAEYEVASPTYDHLAVTYQRPYSLKCSEDSYLEVLEADQLNLTQDLTIEIFFTVDAFSSENGLIAKGKDNSVIPFLVYLDKDGSVVFVFDVDIDTSSVRAGSVRYQFTSTAKVASGKLNKIAIIRKLANPEPPPPKDSDLSTISTDTKQHFFVQIIINGEATGLVTLVQSDDKPRADNPTPNSTFVLTDSQAISQNEDSLTIGRTGDNAFQGDLAEVRLWDVALEVADVGKPIERVNGLVAWWKLNEGEGSTAYDSKGNNDAQIHNPQWYKSPDPDSADISVYINGQAVPTQTTDLTFDSDASSSNEIEFTLDEIRLWETVRTPEEIQDNLFQTLKGSQEGLVAHYAFDDEAFLGEDSSGNGYHLTSLKGFSSSSTAPLSNELPQIRMVPVGKPARSDLLEFDTKIINSPSVAEYADMQVTADGKITGVQKRCYSFIDTNNEWNLLTGYKVGNLVTEWLAQVQADPHIIGYIEGAPPVPSENLTGTSLVHGEVEDYNGATAVELLEADNVNYVFASSKETGWDMALDMNVGAGVGGGISGGIGIQKKVAEISAIMGLHGTFDSSSSHLNEASRSYGQNKTKATRLELKGGWEDDNPEKYINPAVGRRFIPNNEGFALVKSDTMDLYALRLEQNHALVGYRLLPNPDIPKDVNIISFPINQTYTKQGTLDGKVGVKVTGSPQCDPDYPGATNYGEYSYFKPKEAYRLKAKIERERQELLAYYQAFQADATEGANPSTAYLMWNAIKAANQDNKLEPKHFTTSIANTYVWTAAGGFYAESTENLSGTSESTSGSYSINWMAGVYADFNLTIDNFAMQFGMDALFGGHLETMKMASEETEQSFGLEVTCEPESDTNLNCVHNR